MEIITATNTLRADSAHVTPAPAQRYDPHPRFPDELDALDYPEVYASRASGRCLEPVYQDGVCLVFSKTEQPVAGDYVSLWFDPDKVPDGELPRQVKRLLSIMPGLTFPYLPASGSEVEPLVQVEMLNPPRRRYVRASKIVALRKVIGTAEHLGDVQARWKPARTAEAV